MTRISSSAKRWSRAVVTAVAAAALVVPLTGAATPPDAAVPVLTWTDCGDGFQCTTAAVPLDHDEPAGPTIDLSLIRRPASDPAARIGSLFTNPGGPGGPGVDFVRLAAPFFGPDVLARFDIVGVDPRGVGASSPLRCFASPEEQLAFFGAVSPAPVTEEEERISSAAAVELGRRCAERDQGIGAHLSTADVARDLHLLMRAVGDDALNYYGLSYGTYLGATFANLFPDDVRTMVLDGVVDPVTYTGSEGDGQATFVRERSSVGSSETLEEFLSLCGEVGPTACPFAEGGDPAAKFAELAERFREAPASIPTPDGEVVLDYGTFVAITVNSLYADVGWPGLGSSLQEVYLGVQGSALTELMAQAGRTAAPPYTNSPEALRAIVCADTTNPDDPDAWPALGRAADEETPYVGGYWAYISQPCATWPIETQDAYTGPWDATTANPVLVIGTRYDPATPYRNAEALVEELPGSRLLTLEGVGHTSFTQGACVGGAVAKYLTNGDVPAEGTTCFPDRQPFDPITPAAAGAGAARAAGLPPAFPVLPAR